MAGIGNTALKVLDRLNTGLVHLIQPNATLVTVLS